MAKPDSVLKRLRTICLSLPEVTEVVTWGHPTFRAGRKDFAVFEQYRGEWCIAFREGHAWQHSLLDDPRFYFTPYAGKHGWVSLRINGPLDWSEVKELVLQSYRQVALKRMLKAMGESKGKS